MASPAAVRNSPLVSDGCRVQNARVSQAAMIHIGAASGCRRRARACRPPAELAAAARAARRSSQPRGRLLAGREAAGSCRVTAGSRQEAAGSCGGPCALRRRVEAGWDAGGSLGGADAGGAAAVGAAAVGAASHFVRGVDDLGAGLADFGGDGQVVLLKALCFCQQVVSALLLGLQWGSGYNVQLLRVMLKWTLSG